MKALKVVIAAGLAACAIPALAEAQSWQRDVAVTMTDEGQQVVTGIIEVASDARGRVSARLADGRSYSVELTPVSEGARPSVTALITVDSPSVGEASFERTVVLDGATPVRLEFGNSEPGNRSIRVDFEPA